MPPIHSTCYSFPTRSTLARLRPAYSLRETAVFTRRRRVIIHIIFSGQADWHAVASSSEDAVRFIPVQLVSYVGGVLMAPKVKEWMQKQRQGSG